MAQVTELRLPEFYDPDNASAWSYRPDQGKLAEWAGIWRAEHGIRPSQADELQVHLLLIDVQKDFCFPQGSLYVAGRSGTGAIDDTRRLAEFIYRNFGAITHITTTMDTHHAHQIFFSCFWVDAAGTPPAPHRVISADEVDSGAFRPNPALTRWLGNGDDAWLLAQCKHYCRELEQAGKYQLYLWPPHCILGSDGHALAGLVHEARMFHSFARSAQSWVEIKGQHPLTENYSVLGPEVLSQHDGVALAQPNTRFLHTLLAADVVIIAGQAASHCVKNSIDDLLDEIRSRDPALASKFYILTDCMSSVTVPDGRGGFAADFTELAQAALQRYADAGMHLVRSTDAMAGWPGLRLS